MTSSSVSWGCCSNENNEEEEHYIMCVNCKKSFHFLCLSIPIIDIGSELYCNWKCPGCMIILLKTAKKDCTPIRNVSTSRGNKRLALNSPPEERAVTADDVRNIVEDVVKTQFTAMLQQFKSTIINLMKPELEPIKKDIEDLKDSLTHHMKDLDDLQADNTTAKNTIKVLTAENLQLKNSVTDLKQKLNYLEQQSRSNNLELQCLPEHKQENLYTTAKQLGSVVGCDLKDSDILHATRVAKLNTSNPRPRSVVLQLASPRIRDQLLAAVISHNKKNKDNKLNSADFGIAGSKTPVFVVEHLSTANKALHAATRLKAKEKGYKYVWVRGGKIYIKKNEDENHIVIKTLDALEMIK